MDTKKFKTGTTGTANTARGGKNNTKIILTAAGAVAAGMAAGAAASQIFPGPDPNPEPEPTPAPDPSKEDVAQKEELDKENGTGQATTETAQPIGGTAQPTNENISQPQPTTGNGQPANGGGHTTPTSGNGHPTEPSSENMHPTSDGETPQEVAEAIAGAQEIDKNDIDAPTVLEMKEFVTVYNEDGSEIQAVVGETPGGTRYLLADTDGDGIYEGVFDMAGNYIDHAEGNLTHSDIEMMMDQTGGFLAINEKDHVQATEDPTGDILDTETGDHPSLAQNESGTQHEEPIAGEPVSGEQPIAQEEPSADEIDNLLAELLGTDSDSKGVNDEVLVEDATNGSDEYMDGEEAEDDGEVYEDSDDDVDSDEDSATDDF